MRPADLHDVVVVGGGPAGSATARRLAAAGWRTLLLERGEMPRRKPCGECLNPAAVRELARLGVLDRVREAGAVPLRGWEIGPLDRTGFRGCFPPAVHGLGIRRAVLDEILFRAAEETGAEARTGWQVRGPFIEDWRIAGVEALDPAGIPTTVRARLVVAADGLRSKLVRRLRLIDRRPRTWKLALNAHVRGIPPGNDGVLKLGPGLCVGIAPVDGELANVVVVLGEGRIPEAKGDSGGCFDRHLAAVIGNGGATRCEEVLATGPFDVPVRRIVDDHLLLVGDAAGYYDPLTGQGIYRALHGAALAAGVADRALRSPNGATRDALRPYEDAHRRAFSPGRRMQRLVEAVTSRPAIFSPVSRALAARPAAADALVAVTGDIRPVRSLASADVVLSTILPPRRPR